MSITTFQGSTVCTGKGVDVFRLLSIRAMLRLEAAGIKTRGGALRPRLCKEFGLPARAPYAVFTAVINTKLAELEPLVAAENKAEADQA
jgi:hypothetical protein